MSEAIVVTGPPGAGKSAVAAALADRFSPSVLVAGDDFFGFLRQGALPPWQPEAHAQNTAVTEAAAAATGRLTGHATTVYDGVVGPWFVDRFRAEAGLARLHYAILMPPLEVCLERVRTRRGHGFTDLAATARMWHDFHGAITGWERHLHLDGGAGVAVTAERLVEAMAGGSLLLR